MAPGADAARAIGAAWLILAMWAALGQLLGTLFRGPALAVGLGLVWVFLVENLVNLFSLDLTALHAVQEWLPQANASTLTASFGTSGAPESIVLLPVAGSQDA